MVVYLDSSALAKLLIVEPETAALRDRCHGEDLVTSEVGWIECMRVVRRQAGDIEAAEQTLTPVFRLTTDLLLSRDAALLEPVSLRTLDAIHLSSALRVSQDLTAFVCYDKRLAEAAALHGLPVESPA